MILSRGESDVLGARGREQRGLHHGLAHHRVGGGGRGALGVLVHQAGQKLLIERAPIGADAHGLAVLDRHFDDGRELAVALVLEADIAGIDAVFVERLGAGRMIGEQLVADIVEIADQRHEAVLPRQLVADMRHGGGGLVAIDRDAHQLGAGAGERRDLRDGGVDIGRIRIGHGLHDDRRAAADLHGGLAGADLDADRAPTRRGSGAKLKRIVGRGGGRVRVVGHAERFPLGLARQSWPKTVLASSAQRK